jgi:lysophospholipid acyltransferase (LPLAT)-like uncharacterized protein
VKLHKRVLASRAGRELAARLIHLYMRLVWATGGWRVVGREHGERIHAAGGVALCAFWHGRMAMMGMAWPREVPIALLQSPHRDGQLMARVAELFGQSTVWGSSTRGGAGALREVVARLRGGGWCAATPDGPRGPRMRVAAGIVAMARLGGAPILPVSFSTTRGRELGTWDRLLLPWPFGRGAIVVGEPVAVAADADAAALERARLALEEALMRVTREADRLCGRATPEPAPPRDPGPA